MNIDELLENQHIVLECAEPLPGLDADGNECTINCSRLMTVEDAIKFQRAIYCKAGHKEGKDRDFLLDFLAVNWATIYESR